MTGLFVRVPSGPGILKPRLGCAIWIIARPKVCFQPYMRGLDARALVSESPADPPSRVTYSPIIQ
jgi:hypothetical protein